MSLSCDNSNERKIEIKHSKANDLHHLVSGKEPLCESDKKYFWLVMNMPEVIWTTDCKGRTTFISPNVEKIYGYSAEEIYKQGDKLWFVRIHPDDIGKVKKAYRALFEKGTPFDIEYRIKKKGGKWIWLYDRSIATYVKDGLMYADGIFSDITERIRAEQALRASEDKYRNLVEEMTDVIYTLDAGGNITSVNKAAKATFGREPEEVLGKSFTKWIPQEQLPDAMAAFKRILSGEKVTAETIMLDKNRKPHNVEFSSTAIIKDGKVIGTRGLIRDVTERKKVEEKLREYRERLARDEQLASIGTLSASMAHELTQPLMVATLSIEKVLTKLKKTSCPKTVKEGLKDALSGVSRAASIVNGFRNCARKSPQKVSKDVNLKLVADRTIGLLSESAQRVRMTLKIKGMDKLPTIYTVEEDIEQLLFAMAENAIQAADGKKKRQLAVSGAVKNQHIELEFSDNCDGIEPENLERIFEPFFTTKPPGKGTGLGLCIVKSIICRAGGQIRVESKPGKGSTFFVSLPTKRNNGA